MPHWIYIPRPIISWASFSFHFPSHLLVHTLKFEPNTFFCKLVNFKGLNPAKHWVGNKDVENNDDAIMRIGAVVWI